MKCMTRENMRSLVLSQNRVSPRFVLQSNRHRYNQRYHAGADSTIMPKRKQEKIREINASNTDSMKVVASRNHCAHRRIPPHSNAIESSSTKQHLQEGP